MGRFEFEEKDSPLAITNDDLKCRDCIYRDLSRTDTCEAYPICKLLDILNGGSCSQYVKE